MVNLLAIRVPVLLPWGVVEVPVELLPREHRIKDRLHGSLIMNCLETIVDSTHSGSKSAHWIDDAMVPKLFEAGSLDIWGFTELCHIGEEEWATTRRIASSIVTVERFRNIFKFCVGG